MEVLEGVPTAHCSGSKGLPEGLPTALEKLPIGILAATLVVLVEDEAALLSFSRASALLLA